MIDVSHAERMHRWAGGPKKLVIFERGDHNMIFTANMKAYMSELGKFVGSLD